MIEDFMKAKDLKGSVAEAGREILNIGDVPAGVSGKIDLNLKEYAVSAFRIQGKEILCELFLF